MNKRYLYMDILRLIAVVLVMLGHLIGVGTNAKQIPGVINEYNKLPMIDAKENMLHTFEGFLYYTFGTQFAILGVLIFFLATGYLISMMLEKYTPVEFLINRLFRIFPTLIFAVLLNSLFVYLTQGITFSIQSIFVSITLTFSIFSIPATMGILWTLLIEVVFYIIAAMFKKFNVNSLFFLLSFIFIMILFASNTKLNLLYNFVYNLKFISFILIGVAIYLSEKLNNIKSKITIISTSIIFAYSLFRVYKLIYSDESTYTNISSHVFSWGIFILLYILQNKTNIFDKIPSFIFNLADLVYPLYLTHIVFGLGTMYILYIKGVNSYVMVLCGFVISFIISYFVHVLIELPSIKLGKLIIKKFRKLKSRKVEIIT